MTLCTTSTNAVRATNTSSVGDPTAQFYCKVNGIKPKQLETFPPNAEIFWDEGLLYLAFANPATDPILDVATSGVATTSDTATSVLVIPLHVQVKEGGRLKQRAAVQMKAEKHPFTSNQVENGNRIRSQS